jgi:hypothetical protein
MTRSSGARLFRKKSEKIREKAKRIMLKDYPKLMEDPEMKRKTFAAIDNANVTVDDKGEIHLMYEPNDELKNLK